MRKHSTYGVIMAYPAPDGQKMRNGVIDRIRKKGRKKK